MARIETEMTGGRPMIFDRELEWGKHTLVIQTTSGTLALALLPMQGRELAQILIKKFGSAENVAAELNAELRANGLSEVELPT